VRLIIIAGIFSLIFSLFATPILIKALTRRGRSQAIRISEGNIKYPEHQAKIGTPSMGGLSILGGSIVGYVMAHLILWRPPTLSAVFALSLMFGLAAVGFADDYLKIYKQNSRGIRARTKLLGQAIVAFVFGYFVINYADEYGRTPGSQAISFVRDTNFILPTVLFLLLVWFLVTAATNSVNLTDGLDGLATGVSGIIAMTLGIFAYVSGNAIAANYLNILHLPGSGELLIFTGALLGACLGFLWYNSFPAQIFMGDTGSLTLGGIIGALAIILRKELILPVLCGVFVIESLSVIIQVAYFKYTKKKYGEGKRIFLMSPIHHHFQKKGIHEVKIVTRFWLVGVLLAVFTLITLKIR